MEYHDPNYDRTLVLDYKAFLLGLRKTELEVAYVILNDNVSPKLFGFVSKIDDIKFIDGSYHTYCGEIKLVINQFINYWMEVVNDAIREADRITNTITKPLLMEVLDKSVHVHEEKQVDFCKEYLPANSPEEKMAFEEIVEKYKLFMDEMHRIKAEAEEYDYMRDAINFTREHFEVSLERKTALLEYTHSYISLTLSRHIYRIRVSMEECLLRVQNNLKKMEEDRDLILVNLMVELYDQNKERLAICRKENRSSFEEADIEYTLNKLRGKIEDYQKTTPIPRLENEVLYWENRIREYEKIESLLKKLKHEKEIIEEHERQYKSKHSDELEHSKTQCCEDVGKIIQKRKALIDEKFTHAAKTLLTFFGVRGQNRINYTDNIGKYYLDEYGHQIYTFDFGARVYHLDCLGNYKQVNENDKYFYDRNGRHVITEDGNKVYQIAPCTSTYNLCHDGLLEKTTADCGHSDRIRPYCRMQLKDPNDREILPLIEATNIKDTLPKEVVEYLWEKVAHELPGPLRDVGELRANNPIHELAHSLIFQGYYKTHKETADVAVETKKYREKILQSRKEKLMSQSKAWKEKQTKPRKPQESDDIFERMVYDAHVERSEFIRNLEFFDN